MKTKNTACVNPAVFKKHVAAANNFATSLAAGLLFFTVLVAPTHAQRGVGNSTGLARQTVKPTIITLGGRLLEIKTGPCEATTGRSLVGTHILLETPTKDVLNVHLGPAAAVADVVTTMSVGQLILVQAFRTETMKENHYVAQSLTFNQTTAELRDANLRPFWARANTGSLAPSVGQSGTNEGWNPAGGRRGRGWRGGR